MSRPEALTHNPTRSAATRAPSPIVERPLSELAPGSHGLVTDVGGDAGFRQRLLELGVVPGVDVRVVRSAPLGDPLEIEVRGFRLSLRRAEASSILIQVDLDLRQRAGEAVLGPGAAVAGQLRRRLTGPQQPVVAAQVAPHYRVAVAGNPNTGKTTLFNALTGSRGKVGNYPGITVDRRVGRLRLRAQSSGDVHGTEREIELIDIPGTYSLTARSREEQLALDEMLGRTGTAPPDALIVMLNATTLARSLYLLSQVLEFGLPTIAVLNMMDEAEKQGLVIDTALLEHEFGVPFVPVVARTKRGLEGIKERLALLLDGKLSQPCANHWTWEPSSDLASALQEVSQTIAALGGIVRQTHHRRAFALWCLMTLREHDPFTGLPRRLREVTLEQQRLLCARGHDLDLEVVQARYRHVDHLMPRLVRRREQAVSPIDLTGKIDAVLTHPIAGMAVFLVVMALVFTAIFDWAAPVMDAIDALFSALAALVTRLLPEGILTSLLADGLIRGVGSVIVFLPQILILVFFISLLEGTGYMSRAAFLMDRLMRKMGLQGKAFVPLVSGYACAIPAVMATRTLESHRDRLLTMMAIPLVSCSARLPIYTLIIGTLFAAEERVLGPISLGTLMMVAIYMLSMALALVAAGILGRTVLKGQRPPLLIELPPYRLPSASTVALVMLQKARLFLRTAGTVIVAISIVLWALFTFPRDQALVARYERAVQSASQRGDSTEVRALRRAKSAEHLHQSYAGRLGRLIEPVIAPLGFDWKIGIGLIGSFAAREVFVATMGLVYGVGEADENSGSLRQALRNERIYTPLTGLSLLVFFMFAMQCMSTLAVVRQESGSWKWALFMLAYLSALAYGASFLVYQIGR